jgi:hypothetical protein
MRKCPAVPLLSALKSSQVPDFDLLPELAAAIQSLGRFAVASVVPESAAAQFAGGEPLKIFITALVPQTVSNASSLPSLTGTESWIAMSL